MRLRSHSWLACAALLAVVVGGSCTDTGEESESPGYEDVEEIRVIVEATGFACDFWDVYEFESGQRADCTKHSVFGIDADPSETREWLAARHSMFEESVSLLGSNWFVNCPDVHLCTRWQETLGGEVIVGDYSP